jgi:transposase InsO family protein
MCRLLGVARSSFYAWQCAAEAVTLTVARRARYTELVKKVFTTQRGRAGCRTITAILNSQGHPCSVGFVAAIMRQNNLVAVQPRPYKRTTLPGKDPTPATDLITRDFAPGGVPGTRLVGDITYLRTDQGWVYLATVIDLATRMVIGYQLADHMRTSLVTDALQSAIRSGRVRKNAIFHSDKGAQYTSGEFAEYCTKNTIRRSVGRTGVCWDNAVAESFFAALKNEMFYLRTWYTRAHAITAVKEYIEVFYNRIRAHSALRYRTPARALLESLAPTTATLAA